MRTRGNHGQRTGRGGFCSPRFTRAKRPHAFRGVENLSSTIKADLIGLSLQGERPRLVAVAATEEDVAGESKQRTNQVNQAHKEERSFTR
jgi:hypothetical protein